MCGLYCIIHGIFFMVALAFTGFQAMITALFLMTWSYSCYLTLREWLVILYVFFLIMTSVGQVLDLTNNNERSNDTTSVQVMGLLIQVGAQVAAVGNVGKAYFFFRKTGGIWGTAGVQNLAEEKLLQKGHDLAAPVLEKGEHILDQDTRREQKHDLESAEVTKLIAK